MTSSLTGTTPGFAYAVAYFFSCFMFSSLLPRSAGIGRKQLTNLLLLLIVVLFMIATDGVDKAWFVPCMIIIVLLLFGYMYVSCDVNWQKAAYFTVFAFLSGEFSASFGWQLLYYAFTHGIVAPALYIQITGSVIISLLIVLGFYALYGKTKEANAKLEVSAKEMSIALIIGLSVYVISNMSYIADATPFSSRYPSETFIIRTMTDLGGCGLLLAYHTQLIELRARAEMHSIEQMLHLQYEQYELSRESIELVEQKYHDLKHQIQMLKADIASEEKRQYLSQMEEEIRSFEAQNKTGNQVLDTILMTKSIQCQKQDIALTVVADGAELNFMNAMDIAALFGNALDNAIESVCKIEDKDKRLIHLSVSRQKAFVRIRAENCYEGELCYINGVLKTTKADRKYHGYGLKSIKRIAENYGGSCTTQTKDNWFELRVLIPVPAENTAMHHEQRAIEKGT